MTRQLAASFVSTFPFVFVLIVWLTPDRAWRWLVLGLLNEWAWVVWFGPWNFILPPALQNLFFAIVTTIWVVRKARRA